MKIRGGLLALLVLGIATILMVFFVLPRISGDKNATPEVAAPATPPAAKPAETTAPDPVAASAKMDRLVQTANSAVRGLADLFADGKVPGADIFAGARATAETALSALAATELPEGIEAGLAETIAKARTNASRALGLLKALPADPKEAAAAIGGIVQALAGAESAPAAAMPAEVPKAANEAAPAAADKAATTADAASGDARLPKFDILRVEPDGSTVIAGSAAPGSTRIEIVDGDKVLSTAVVGPTGDFAAVLDNPLPPGDHAIALRAIDDKGAAVTSDEVATVSVPEKSDGKLLAMISKPGEASRVITMPETINTGDKQARVAADGQPAPSVATPDLPQASALLTTSPPPIGDGAAGSQSSSTATAEVKVTAVEIEGDRIFIAGTAPRESRVRAYADEKLVGDAATDSSSHFVVEGRVDLTVGTHTIRVDLMDATGQVTVRTSVPFDRPSGEQVAVVASGDGATNNGALVPLEQGAFDKNRDALSRAFTILTGLYADGKKPTLDALAAARSATEIALQSLADFRPATEASQVVAERVAATARNAGTALAALRALPGSIDAVGAALPEIAALIDAVLQVAPGEAPSASAVPAPAPTNAAGTSPAPASAESASGAAAGAPKIVEQAPLTASRDSVIIRQGDTLWQISRRVYGQGVRYTTIYLANEDQILNPDQIEPGQIFNVPGQALPNAEELHRRRLRGEAID